VYFVTLPFVATVIRGAPLQALNPACIAEATLVRFRLLGMVFRFRCAVWPPLATFQPVSAYWPLVAPSFEQFAPGGCGFAWLIWMAWTSISVA
jgi:hypothetical protein